MVLGLVEKNIAIVSILLSSQVFSHQSVEIVTLGVPAYPKVGDDVTLTCEFVLESPNHNLYTVNWWRGKDQFYTYKVNNYNPKHAYSFDGINVDIEASDESAVVLRDVSEFTSGEFKCEVMGEGPEFRTAVRKAQLHVIVPPRSVEITRGMNRAVGYKYQLNDVVSLNCTAHHVRPRPRLLWRVNGQEVEPDEVRRFPDEENYDGRITSTLGLRFVSPKYFVNMVADASCTVFVRGHEFQEKQRLQLDSLASFHVPSAAAGLKYSNGCLYSTMMTVFYFGLILTF